MRRRGEPGQVLVEAGLVALLAGVQLIGLLTLAWLALGASPAWLYQQWFVAVGLVSGGAVLGGAGTLRFATVVAVLRGRRPSTWAAVGAAAVLGWLLGVWTIPAGSRYTTIGAVALPIVQLGLIGVWARWSRPSSEPLPRLHARTWPNVAIVVFLSLSGATAALALHDVYPFSRYPMFASSRLDPYTLERVTFVAEDTEGSAITLRPPASRQVLLDLVADGDGATLRGMAARLADVHEVDRIVVHLEVVAIAEHPAPPAIEVRDRSEVLTYER